MGVSTIYLTGDIAPGGKNWVKGYIERHDALGVMINTRDDGRGERTFYPTHNIQLVKMNTGW